MARSNAEVISDLPKYEVTPSQEFPEYLIVRCPREDCPSHGKDATRPFLVHRRTWQRPRFSTIKRTRLLGRPCPYCSRANAMR